MGQRLRHGRVAAARPRLYRPAGSAPDSAGRCLRLPGRSRRCLCLLRARRAGPRSDGRLARLLQSGGRSVLWRTGPWRHLSPMLTLLTGGPSQEVLRPGATSLLEDPPKKAPRARGIWSVVGRRGTELPTPPCLNSSASSSYLYLAPVSVPGSVSPGAPAAVLVSPSLPGSPRSFSASEWVALPCPGP